MNGAKLLIAAGGTGGHLFPGIAVAQVWKGETVFVGSDRGLERDILKDHGLPHRALSVGRIKGEGVLQKLKTFAGLPKSFFQARDILREEKPDVVLGIGGYSSGPMILAARSLKIPRAILEPNAIPGFTNKRLAPFAQRVFVAFPEAKQFFSSGKTRVTGTPVRSELHAVGEARKSHGDVFTIAVLGGSQGAQALNRAMVDLLPDLKVAGRKFYVIHQTGGKDETWVREAYAASGIPHQVGAFLRDMTSVYAKADLVVCRAGASTIAELEATRTPAILVPYPFAADDHQRYNAESLAKTGAAEFLDNRELGTKLKNRILALAGDPKALESFSEKLKERRATPAALEVTKECWELCTRH